MKKTIDNGQLRISVNEMGAELCEIYDLEEKRDVLWDGNPDCWAGFSPLLFPNCGLLLNNAYTYEGKQYTQPNHGFAKSSLFEFAGMDENSISYRLQDNEETRANYPFSFLLEVTHRLEGRNLQVEWKVSNRGDKPMPFSIGGHSAFRTIPTKAGSGHAGCYLVFDSAGEKVYQQKTPAGPLSPKQHRLAADEGRVQLTADFFAKDLLLFENQTQSMGLADENGKLFIMVRFAGFPVVVAWAKPNAPFVCIEPWYGAPDEEDFTGCLSQRKNIQLLSPGETWSASYSVECIKQK